VHKKHNTHHRMEDENIGQERAYNAEPYAGMVLDSDEPGGGLVIPLADMLRASALWPVGA
jgi:hypothetical protein